jgi:hypothetical protein
MFLAAYKAGDRRANPGSLGDCIESGCTRFGIQLTSYDYKDQDTICRSATIFRYHRLDTLVHTMRCITQYEDALCSLSHELKGTGTFSEEASEELRDILEKIPSHDYLVDLDAVRDILTEYQSSNHAGSKGSSEIHDSS